MARLSRTLGGRCAPLAPENSPRQVRWHYPKVSVKERGIPDFSLITMGAILISEAMKDMLSGFNLGEMQMIELPLHDASKAYGRVRADPDFSKKESRRWFVAAYSGGALHTDTPKTASVFSNRCNLPGTSGQLVTKSQRATRADSQA
ncbi:MAG: hypothetical protein AAGA74_15065 [Pseudomonadota bacterium]